jgi:YD repeat-containing protein
MTSSVGYTTWLHKWFAANSSQCSLLLSVIGITVGAWLLGSTVAQAQADFEKGYQAFQSYHGADFDSVNLANGNLVLNIPLLSYEQRGDIPAVTIAVRSNSTTFQSTPPYLSGPADVNQHEVASGVIGAPWGQPHVMISPGGLFWKEERIVTEAKSAIGPEYLVRFVATDDSGATHSLGGSIFNSAADNVPGIRYSVDGSGLMLQPGTTSTGPLLVDRNGNTGGMADYNGNTISLKGPCATASGSGDYFDASLPSWEGYAHGTASATNIVDSIGRGPIPNPSYLPPVGSYSCLVDIDASYHAVKQDLGNACPEVPLGGTSPSATTYYADTFEYPAEAGGTVPLTFCYAQTPVSAQIPQIIGSGLTLETINESWWVLTSVTLPNGTQWTFGYDNYGQVSQVTLPTGGKVTYQYATRLACGNPPGQLPVQGTPIWPYTNILSSRMVVQRNVYLNATDSQPIEIWTYNNAIGSGWMGAPLAGTLGIQSPGGRNQGQVTVTDPQGNQTVHTFSLIGGSTCGPYETTTQYYQGSSTLLKQVDTTYSYTGTDYANPTNFSNYIALGVFPLTVKTTIPTSGSPLVSYDTYQYDSFGTYQDYLGTPHTFSLGQLLSSTESNYGSTAPLRTTLHTNVWQSNWNYFARNLIDLPCLDTEFSGSYTNAQSTCAPQSAPSNQISQTISAYDESSRTGGAVTWGLPTTVTHWLQGAASSSWPSTHNVYNASSYGMPTQKWDANGNETQLFYDASGLYLNKIQHPDGSVEYPTYDDYTGLLISHQDVNGQSTGYSYDAMRRLLGVQYPTGGGSESLSYNDQIGSLSVTFTKAITSSSNLVKEAFADGLGRLTLTELVSDPNGADYTATGYNALGRVCAVSNPTRSVLSRAGLSCNPSLNPAPVAPTDGISYTSYDALGRKSIITAPDGTKRQTCFNGINTIGLSNCHSNLSSNPTTWEDDTDENGNDWQRVANGLGQMTSVFEPNGGSSSASMETDYSYDMLNNLQTVNQWGGSVGSSGARTQRTFYYDSLSRLTSSYNPEAGTTTYSYDANGNVKARTDARSITTNYQYDSMNRLYCKSYSGDPGNTPTSWYLYGLPGGSISNAVGRLIDAWTMSASAGSCPSTPPLSVPSGYISMQAILSYDAMGRVTSEQQYTPGSIAKSTSYPMAYTYDLAGDLTSSTAGAVPPSMTLSMPSAPCAGSPSFSTTMLMFVNCYDGAGRLASVTSNAGTGSNSMFAASSFAAFGGLTNATYGGNGSGSNAVALGRTYDNRLRITSETDLGNDLPSGTNTNGSAQVTITGTEQSH